MSLPRFSMPGRDDDHEDELDEARVWPSAFDIAGPSQDHVEDGVQDELARMATRTFTRDLMAWVGDRADHAASNWSVTHFATGTAVITIDLPRVKGLERPITIRIAVSEHDGVIGDPGA